MTDDAAMPRNGRLVHGQTDASSVTGCV